MVFWGQAFVCSGIDSCVTHFSVLKHFRQLWLFSLMNLPSYLISVAKWGLTFSLLPWIVARLAIPSKKSFLLQWLQCCMIVEALVFLIIATKEISLFITLLTETPFRKNSFEYSQLDFFAPYGMSFYFTVFAPLIILLLIFAARKKYYYRFIWLLLCLLYFHFETIVIYITKFYGDFLPSSWSVYYSSPYDNYLVYFLIFNILVMCIFFLQRWRTEKQHN